MTWYLNSNLKRCRRIILRDITREVRIGAYDHERLAAQPVIFNIEVFVTTANERDDKNREQQIHATAIAENFRF